MSSQNEEFAILDENISQNQLTFSKPEDGCGGVEYMETVDEVPELQVEMNKNPVSTAPTRSQTREPSGAQHVPHQATQVQVPSIIDQLKARLTETLDNKYRYGIQQQLYMYFHVQNCELCKMRQTNGEQDECNLYFCKYLKNVMKHSSTCQVGDSCTVPHCSSSRHVMDHWKNCPEKDCSICLLSIVRSNTETKPMNWFFEIEAAQHNSYDSPALANVRQAYKDMDYIVPTTSGTDGVVMMHTATFAENSKEWHDSVSFCFRTHLLIQLFNQIYTSDAPPMSDPKVQGIIERIKKIEYDMFKEARSRRNYYDLIKEKMAILKYELELTERLLREQQQQPRPTHQHGAAHDN